MKSFCWTVGEEDNLTKLPAFLCTKKELNLPSQKKARQLLERGVCSINGAIRTFASTVVVTGDTVSVLQPESKGERLLPTIVYEDSDLFVVDKPAGLQCEQTHFEKALCRPCYMVHRLDKETSGLLIVAKNLQKSEELQVLFMQKEVQKQYLAIVDGLITKKKGLIDSPMEMKGRVGSSVYWGIAQDGGKPCRTEYQVLISNKEASLVLLRPRTGRTHQLRVHMASIGHPILGDYHYADTYICSQRPNRHLLHAWRLSFKNISCQSTIPIDFKRCASRLFGEDWEELL